MIQSNYIKLNLGTEILNLKITDEIWRNAQITNVMNITISTFYHTPGVQFKGTLMSFMAYQTKNLSTYTAESNKLRVQSYKEKQNIKFPTPHVLNLIDYNNHFEA